MLAIDNLEDLAEMDLCETGPRQVRASQIILIKLINEMDALGFVLFFKGGVLEQLPKVTKFIVLTRMKFYYKIKKALK